MKHTFFTLILVLATISCSDDDFEITGETEDFEITSSIVNDTYYIEVFLPPGYPESNVEYPLIVGLDGDAEFDSMAGIVSEEIEKGNIPSSIFISIGYGSISKNDKKRNRDYTPSVTQGVENSETGGASDFYAFIKDELIPEVQSRYQIDLNNTATLMGHSYGGLFTLYAMFQDRSTNPFGNFIPVASSFWYDSGVIFESEETYARNNPDLPIIVFTTMGSLEGAVMVASFEEMNERLKNRNYSKMKYKSELLKKYGHSRSDYISYEKGLSYVFNN